MIFIFSGLPGAGKSTVSQRLAQERRAVHLRIDVIEQAMRDAGMPPTGPEGYIVAYALAEHNLRLGLDVVADSVNPLRITRDAWRDVAIRAGVPYVEIEVVCSDREEHRRRVESRPADIAGHRNPTWAEVIEREYEPWDREVVVLDTASLTIEDSLAALEQMIALYRPIGRRVSRCESAGYFGSASR